MCCEKCTPVSSEDVGSRPGAGQKDLEERKGFWYMTLPGVQETIMMRSSQYREHESLPLVKSSSR